MGLDTTRSADLSRRFNRQLRTFTPVGASQRQSFATARNYDQAMYNIQLMQKRFDEEREKIFNTLSYSPTRPKTPTESRLLRKASGYSHRRTLKKTSGPAFGNMRGIKGIIDSCVSLRQRTIHLPDSSPLREIVDAMKKTERVREVQ